MPTKLLQKGNRVWARRALYLCYVLIALAGVASLIFHPPNSIELVAPRWERILWELELIVGPVVAIYGLGLRWKFLYNCGVSTTTVGLVIYVVALGTQHSWTLVCLVSALAVLGLGEVMEAFSGGKR